MEMEDVECRLIRADGTEWRVRSLDLSGHGLRVDAEPVNGAANGDAAGSRETGGTSNGGRPHETLEDEPLARGDRMRWIADDGREVWSMRVPMGGSSVPEPERGGRGEEKRPA